VFLQFFELPSLAFFEHGFPLFLEGFLHCGMGSRAEGLWSASPVRSTKIGEGECAPWFCGLVSRRRIGPVAAKVCRVPGLHLARTNHPWLGGFPSPSPEAVKLRLLDWLGWGGPDISGGPARFGRHPSGFYSAAFTGSNPVGASLLATLQKPWPRVASASSMSPSCHCWLPRKA
jgi:hypothetical protein